MGPLVVLLAAATSTSTSCAVPAETPASLVPQAQAALAVELRHHGKGEEAIHCLRAARAADPASASIARDLALLLAEVGEVEEAARLTQAAIDLGDGDPETLVLLGVLLARSGDKVEARAVVDRASTWEGQLVGAALGNGAAANRSAELIEEESARGAAASLLLAGREAERGEIATASRLAALAETQARAVGANDWLRAARAMSRRLEERADAPAFSLRLRSALDYSTNPAFVASGASKTPALRLALTAEGGVEIGFGRWSASGSARIDEHTFISERPTLDRYDLLAYDLAVGLHYSLSRNPSSAVIGLVARFSDVFGDWFAHHYATAMEGGPNLALRISSRLGLEIGLYGSAVDFIELSPPDASISSLNRDRVGQRAVFGLTYEDGWITGRADGMFLHDSALGDAFDAIGGALAARGAVQPIDGVLVGGGVAVTVRDFGPVGDEAIIGPAATRLELRVEAELSVRVVLTEQIDVLVEYQRITTEARTGHEYSESLLSMGAEARW